MPVRRLPVVLAGCGWLLLAPGGCPPATTPPEQPPPSEKTLHERIFTEIIPEGFRSPADCMICHPDIGRQVTASAHWQWQGPALGLAGHQSEIHGKRDLLNNFWIGVPSNEGACAQCHISFGWRDRSFDFASIEQIDCFICHDTTGTYAKHPTAGDGGGSPALRRDGRLDPVGFGALQEIVYHVGPPTRRSCGSCHFYADGGDNVKHGDLSSDLAAPSRELDVHMGGLDFACTECHAFQAHGIAGFTIHSVNEGGPPPDCVRCHGTDVHRANPAVSFILNDHTDRVACETCHIPRFARSKPTLVAWRWDSAGQVVAPIPTDAEGNPTYDPDRGTLTWGRDLRPSYRWHDGTWRARIIGLTDVYTEAGTAAEPVVIAEPAAAPGQPGAKVYPFKRMLGTQPADTVNRRLLVPHLFGGAGGPHPFWEEHDWAGALADGAVYTGVPYSGEFGFPATVTYLGIHHEVAPRAAALTCFQCHRVPAFWQEIGTPDPLGGGG